MRWSSGGLLRILSASGSFPARSIVNEKGVIQLEVHQQAYLLQYRWILHQLSLVDDDDGLLSLRVKSVQDLVNAVKNFGAVLRCGLLSQLLEHLPQKVHRGATGIVDKGDLGPLRIQLLQQRADQQRLAASRFFRQQRRAAVALQV